MPGIDLRGMRRNEGDIMLMPLTRKRVDRCDIRVQRDTRGARGVGRLASRRRSRRPMLPRAEAMAGCRHVRAAVPAGAPPAAIDRIGT